MRAIFVLLLADGTVKQLPPRLAALRSPNELESRPQRVASAARCLKYIDVIRDMTRFEQLLTLTAGSDSRCIAISARVSDDMSLMKPSVAPLTRNPA